MLFVRLVQGIRRARPTQHRRIKKARDMGGQQHDNREAFEAQLFGREEEGEEGEGGVGSACWRGLEGRFV